MVRLKWRTIFITTFCTLASVGTKPARRERAVFKWVPVKKVPA